jgi:hypothetical protein
VTDHTTHHDDCGCKSAEYEKRIATLEAELSKRRANTMNVVSMTLANEKRIATLEAALRECAMQAIVSSDVGRASRKVCEVAQAALAGEPTALTKMLERGVSAGRFAGMADQRFLARGYNEPEPKASDADIAKRVMEGE